MSFPILSVPLVGPKVKLGVINVTEKNNSQAFTNSDIDIFFYIANSAAIAINNILNEAKIEEGLIGTIKALAGAIEAKDPYTRGHSDRVAELSTAIGVEMGLSAEEVELLNFAGILYPI